MLSLFHVLSGGFLVSQVLAHKHHLVAAGIAAIAQQVNVAADALGRIAVVASAVDAARCVDVEALGVDGRCG